MINEKQKQAFYNAYNRWMNKLVNDLVVYRENMVKVMAETDLKTFSCLQDFKDMGKEALLWKADLICREEANLCAAKKLTIIQPDDFEEL